MQDNLMLDALIPIRCGGEVSAASLPGVLAALHADGVEAFPALRPHQRHPWHAFLCQLAVMALEQGGCTDMDAPLDEAAWRDLLRGLTPGFPDDEPWRLVVEDLSRPAFLQPPVPEGTLKAFKVKPGRNYGCPGNLDVVVMAKQHGEKEAFSEPEAPDRWGLPLLMLQTFSGFLGRGNYGIARQNGGFAARHGVGVRVAERPGPNWRRDCRVLLRELSEPRGAGPYPEEGGLRLLWLEPWGGGKSESLPLQRLHPLFVEVCRRVRLVRGPGGIEYRSVGTEGARVAAGEYNGVVGDPWLPVNVASVPPKAFNSKPGYARVAEVLFDRSQYEPALLQRLRDDDPEEGVAVVFRVFLRVQGGSDGYHERVVPVHKDKRGFFGRRREEAAETSARMVELARAARNRVLKPALLQVMQAAKDRVEYGQKETNAWAGRFADALDDRVDAEFFPLLWRCLDERGGAAELRMAHLAPLLEFLAAHARGVFGLAVDGLPMVGGLRYRALAKGENCLESMIRNHLSTKE